MPTNDSSWIDERKIDPKSPEQVWRFAFTRGAIAGLDQARDTLHQIAMAWAFGGVPVSIGIAQALGYKLGLLALSLMPLVILVWFRWSLRWQNQISWSKAEANRTWYDAVGTWRMFRVPME
jgi:hypothetical protein